MKFTLENGKTIDTSQPIDISLPLTNDQNNPRAWYVSPPVFEPVRENGWIGSIEEGGTVNFRNIFFNPHGHGTHTECLGHITPKIHSINRNLKEFFFEAELVTVTPEKITRIDGSVDEVVTLNSFDGKIISQTIEALIIRTTPNTDEKKTRNYSSSNPPYFDIELLPFLEALGVKHLLLDLPSVDKELDGGVLAFHHGFWQVPENPQLDKTITELIFIDDEIKDGQYVLNLQVAPFENDAAPSRPVLFQLL